MARCRHHGSGCATSSRLVMWPGTGCVGGAIVVLIDVDHGLEAAEFLGAAAASFQCLLHTGGMEVAAP